MKDEQVARFNNMYAHLLIKVMGPAAAEVPSELQNFNDLNFQ